MKVEMWGITRDGQLAEVTYKTKALAKRVAWWMRGYCRGEGAIKFKVVRVEVREVRKSKGR